MRDRSPFARRVLGFIAANYPTLTSAQIAREVGVTRQAFNKWLWNEATPDLIHVEKLAAIIGCTVEELQLDLDASKGWQPPISFRDFYTLVEQTATAEHWRDKDDILPWLRIAIIWQDIDTFSANFARDVLVSKVPLHTKAMRLARIVQTEKELGNG